MYNLEHCCIDSICEWHLASGRQRDLYSVGFNVDKSIDLLLVTMKAEYNSSAQISDTKTFGC